MKELKTDWIDELTYIPDDEYFHEGLATFYKCGKWGFIDKKGIVVIPCIFDSAGDFSEGFAGIKCNEKWGFVDNTGREVIPCQYVSTMHFQEGKAQVNENDTQDRFSFARSWIYIDKTGRRIIEKKTENDSASQKISDPDDDLPF